MTTTLDVTVSQLDQVLAVLFARSPWDEWRVSLLGIPFRRFEQSAKNVRL